MAYAFNDDKSKVYLSVDMVYPVGSIYMSVNSTNPGTLFEGTTWEQIQDRFLLAAGSTYKAGTQGGEAAHKLTTSELPSHTHDMNKSLYTSFWGLMIGDPGARDGVMTDNWDTSNRNKTWPTGGNEAHNNMPPYLTVYVWKRTA